MAEVAGDRPVVAGMVLAAGGSRRLGEPKQLLDVGGRRLLDVTLDTARACGFDQLIVALGGAGAAVREAVDLTGCTVVDNVDHSSGCSSSIVASLSHVDPLAVGFVLLLGDQPGIDPAVVGALRAAAVGARVCADLPCGPVTGDRSAGDRAAGVAPLAVCRYDDGPGHPFWFSREVFHELRGLHGDKAVWRLLESGRWPVVQVPVAGTVPPDVDTWDDHRRLLEAMS